MPATITATVEGTSLFNRARFTVRVEVEEQERPRSVTVYADPDEMYVDLDDAAWDAVYEAGLTPVQTISIGDPFPA